MFVATNSCIYGVHIEIIGDFLIYLIAFEGVEHEKHILSGGLEKGRAALCESFGY